MRWCMVRSLPAPQQFAHALDKHSEASSGSLEDVQYPLFSTTGSVFGASRSRWRSVPQPPSCTKMAEH